MSTTSPTVLTLQDFLQLPDIDEAPAWEYHQGAAEQKVMGGGKHSTLQKRLVGTIDGTGDRYEAFPELRCTFGGRSIVPDVAVVARELVPVDDTGDIIATGIEFAPTWAIEILSPHQNQTKVTGKLLHCLHHGTQLGWLLDPQTRSVLVYWPQRLPQLCSGRDRLPVLPDLRLELSAEQVFGWLRR